MLDEALEAQELHRAFSIAGMAFAGDVRERRLHFHVIPSVDQEAHPRFTKLYLPRTLSMGPVSPFIKPALRKNST
jgi:hypothetical protein